MEIRDIMKKDVLTLKPDQTIAEAVKFLSENMIGGAPVVDKENRLLGILSEVDIIKTLKTKTTKLSMVFPSSHSLGLTFQESIVFKEIQDAFEEIGHMEVRDIMTSDIITAGPDQTLEEVAPNLLKEHVKRVPILEDDRVIGIITRRDIIKGLISEK
jgi:CBS domain-containing protein